MNYVICPIVTDPASGQNLTGRNYTAVLMKTFLQCNRLINGNKKLQGFSSHSLLPLFSGRVFVLDLRNSSGLQGFRDAERACATRHARLASAQELQHAVVECFFSSCTRGWLYGGTVG